jgi:adenine-specific DNA-methyltransferase
MDAYADSITSERIKRIIQGYSAQRNFKKVLFSKKISISDFKNIKLYESVEEIIKKEKENFNKVESKIDNGLLKVVGVSSQKTFINGLKSDFSYYEIGEPLLEGDVLNPRVAVEQIRSYIWYMETRQPYQKPAADNEAFLGQENGTAYYFHYDPAQRRLLDEEFLRSITTRAEHYVIYADECLLSEAFLQKHAITFKKIPRDIARL